ncbi:MAG TPA: DDE-type integrase/transposase/recombinase [Bryobacteraceae bacterium]|nr:DDE-type integrase/transposase/recombinase [Bryobacteraceae bacterium]
MLSPEAMGSWCKEIGVLPHARALIDQIRTSDPARRVGGGRSNVSGRYPSRKMGVTIQFESHRVELAGIYEMEHDLEVLEFYDQPLQIKLNYESPGGKRLGVLHTPDFFVIRRNAAGWEEWKSEEDLLQLAERSPNRYLGSEDGQWRCLPGEACAREFGFYYRVRSSREINWVYQRNIQFLEDYLRSDLPIRAGTHERLRDLVSARFAIGLSDLFRETEGIVTRDEIFAMIALGPLEVDLSAAPLTEPSNVRVLLNHPQAVTCPPAAISASASGPSGAGLLPQMGPTQVAEANRRLKLIRAYQAREPLENTVSARTARHWLLRYRHAEALHGDGYLGLLPRFHLCGNRNRKLPERTRALMSDIIGADYETVKQKRKFHVYGALILACEAEGLAAPSYKTFSVAINRRLQGDLVFKRRGRRAAYQLDPPYLELHLTTPRHGDRPFHICHSDHTELDVEVVCSSTGRNLGRPWLTILIDAFSRRLLALFLAFDPPSYRSCMMILRECVHRHGRLPQILVVDGGKEFESVYFETLLARYECTKKTRPPAQPRFGSVCERIFGTSTQLIYSLAGNTQITRNVRQVTTSVDPRNHAVWTLEFLHSRLCEWAYEFYDTTMHPALGQSPRECFTLGLERSGNRPHRQIPYDDEFRMMTLPTTAKGTALVHSGKGVKINHLHYWSTVFRDPAVERTRVPVRYDPYDAGTAYAYVGNRWVSCYSEHFSSFRGRSEREMMIAAAELRKRAQDHSREFQVTAKRLADFVASVEAEESLLIQRLQDAAARRICQVKCEKDSRLEQDVETSCDCALQSDPDAATLQPSMNAGGFVPPPPEQYEEY